MEINEFTGKAGFLALEYPCSIEFEGIEFQNAANLFYALKTTDKGMMRKIARLNPNKARQKVAAWRNDDYDEHKEFYLEKACRCKFDSNPTLKEWLVATNDAMLINTVEHRDEWIGVRGGKGYNALGKVLMKIRETYIHDNHIQPKSSSRFSISVKK